VLQKKNCVEAVIALLIPMKFFRRTLFWVPVRNIDACVRCSEDRSMSIESNVLVAIALAIVAFTLRGKGHPEPLES